MRIQILILGFKGLTESKMKCTIKATSAKALALSVNNLTSLILTPLNADNGPLFLAQSTDSHRRSFSLMLTLHCQLCALKIPFPFETVDSMSIFPVV